MVKHKQSNYLYLGKLGKLANPTKNNFGKPKMDRHQLHKIVQIEAPPPQMKILISKLV